MGRGRASAQFEPVNKQAGMVMVMVTPGRILALVCACALATATPIAEENSFAALAADAPPGVQIFGEVRARDIDLLAGAHALLDASAPEMAIYRVEVSSPGAVSLAVHFDVLEGVREGQLSLWSVQEGADAVPFMLRVPGNASAAAGIGAVSAYVPGDRAIVQWEGTRAEAARGVLEVGIE